MIEVAIAALISLVTVINGPAVPANPVTGYELPDRGAQVQITPPPPPPPTAPPAPAGLWGQPFAPAGLSNCDEMNFYRVQWQLPSQFAGIGWRESNCRNEDGVRTSCCHGYWQFHRIHINGSGLIYGMPCEVYSVNDLNSDTPIEKQKQACAVKALYEEAGMSPWSLTYG